MNLSPSDNIHRGVPASLESEQGVLCSIFLEPSQAITMCEEMISPEMVHHPSNKAIYEAILALHSKGGHIDAISLTAALQEARMLEAVGGPGYLAQLQTVIPTWRNLKWYLEVVRNCFHKRQLLKSTYSLQEAVFGDADEITGSVQEMQKAIEGWRDSSSAVDDIGGEVWHKAMDDMEEKNERRMKGGGLEAILGIPTGLRRMDKMDGGLKPKVFTIIAARPSQGKTRLATQILLRAAKEGNKSLFFSLEMSGEDVVQSVLCQNGAVNVDGAFNGYLREADFPRITSSVGELRKLMYIDDSPTLTVAQIRSRAKRFMLKHPDTKIIAVDHHMRIKASQATRKNSSGEEMLSEIAIGLSEMRKELGVHLILLCQINRQGSKERPRMDHIKGSGAFEAEADNIWLIDMEENTDASIRQGKLHKDKGRNSALGTIDVEFYKNSLTFKEV